MLQGQRECAPLYLRRGSCGVVHDHFISLLWSPAQDGVGDGTLELGHRELDESQFMGLEHGSDARDLSGVASIEEVVVVSPLVGWAEVRCVRRHLPIARFLLPLLLSYSVQNRKKASLAGV